MTMSVIAVALALPLFLNLFLQNARQATGGWNAPAGFWNRAA